MVKASGYSREVFNWDQRRWDPENANVEDFIERGKFRNYFGYSVIPCQKINSMNWNLACFKNGNITKDLKIAN